MEGRDIASRVLGAAPGSPEFIAASRELARLAFCGDPATARPATRTVFGDIVEPWSDRFEPDLCDAYAAFMSELLHAPGSPVASALAKLRLPGPDALRARYRKIREGRTDGSGRRETVRRVVVLSRVTLGADIAVTSAVIRGVLLAFPAAQVHFVAPRKNIELIADGDRVLGQSVSYDRGALLGDRLRSWFRLREQVQASIRGLGTGEWIVVDPDSRLTQLGLLPLADDHSYRFFESRSFERGSRAPLGRLAASWCRSCWDVDVSAITPFARSGRGGDGLAGQLRALGKGRVAAVSFGVGGRESKRLGSAFEDRLLGMLRARGYHTVLDCGAGQSEARDASRRFRAFAGSKSHRDEGQATAGGKLPELVTWKGSLAGFGRLVRSSSVYVGYDSAAGHLAAAHATPVVSVFAGAPSDRFLSRWTPWGRGPVHVIPAIRTASSSSVLARIATALDALEARPCVG